MRRPASWVCALVALALSLSACGRDDPQEPEANGGSQTTASPADGTQGTATGGSDDGGSADGGHGHETAAFPAAEATDVAKISMRDYVFVDLPATVTGPKLRIEVANNGPSAHEVLVFDADGNEVGGTDPIAPGDAGVVSLELTAGTYEMRCQIAISETETHLDRGMKAVFQVM